jgi:hypothetical protein
MDQYGKKHGLTWDLYIEIGVCFVCDHALTFLNYGALTTFLVLLKNP